MIRLDKLSKVFGDVLIPNFGPDVGVFWSFGAPTGEQIKKDTILLKVSSGPFTTNQGRVRPSVFVPPTSLTLTVESANEGKRYWINLNGYYYVYDAVALNTVDSIRNALVSSVEADPYNGITASATLNPGELVLTPDSFGGIWYCSTNLAATDVVLSETAALWTRGQSALVVNVQAYSKNMSLWGGALGLLNKVQDVVQRQSTVSAFYREGVSFTNRGVVTDITALSGPNWESRATLDLGITMLDIDVEPTEIIDMISPFTVQLLEAPKPLPPYSFTVSSQ